MATRRTQAELQALFAAGQPAGAITPDRVQDGSNVNIQVAVALNGNILTDSIQAVRVPSGGGAAEAVVLAGFVSDQDDYFELWARNTTNANDITANSLVLRVGGFVL